MSVNLLFRELKSNLKGTIITGISAALYIAFSFSIYSVMKENIPKITEFYQFMPQSFRLAFNMDLNQWDNVMGFYVTYFVYYVPIIAGCYSIILGMKVISKEEHFKTAEFLLSHPLSRSQIISSKLIALIIHVLGINFFTFLTAFVSCVIVSEWEFSIRALAVLHTYGFLICGFFGIVGFFITVIMKRAKAVIGLGIGIVLGTYFFDMMLRISDKVKFLLYFTPYKYMDLQAFAKDYGFETWRLLFFFGVSGLLIMLSFLFYRRKDILV